MNWNLLMPKHTLYCKDSLEDIVNEFAELGIRRPLFVLSGRTLATPIVQSLLNRLKHDAIPYGLSCNVAAEAPMELVQEIKKDFVDNGCDSIIAIGGGSVLDLAKAASILCTHAGRIEDYLGSHKVPSRTVPKILISTTSGTGSETTNISILSDKQNRSKMGIVSNHIFADLVVLNPALSYSMPSELAVSSGLDALCQCIEAMTTKTGSPIVDLFALKGIGLIANNLDRALEGDMDARDSVHLGAYMSGIVISAGNAGTNIGHALGNTIGGMYGIPHGIAVAMVLPEGIRFNLEDPAYRAKVDIIESQTGLDIIEFIEGIKARHKIPGLSHFGVREDDLADIADKVIKDQGRPLANNLRAVSAGQIMDILRRSL